MGLKKRDQQRQQRRMPQPQRENSTNDHKFANPAYQMIWQKLQAGESLAGEEAAVAQAMQEHPEYRASWDLTRPRSELKRIGKEVRPGIHIAMHVLVENQLCDETLPEVQAALDRLMAKGLSRHDAVHQIGVEALLDMQESFQLERKFNRAIYVQRLREMVERVE